MGSCSVLWEKPQQIRQEIFSKATRAGTDAFHPRLLLDRSDATCLKSADSLHAVDVAGKWPAVASFIMFFITKDCTQLAGQLHDTISMVGRVGADLMVDQET